MSLSSPRLRLLLIVSFGALLTFGTLYAWLAQQLPAAPQASPPPASAPQTAEQWIGQAREQASQRNFAAANRAYREALALRPKDPELMVDHADTLAAEQGGELQGEPLRLIERALALAPKHVKGLALAGTAAFRRADYAGALQHWRAAVANAPADSPFLPGLQRSIQQAEAKLSSAPLLTPLPQNTAPERPAPVAAPVPAKQAEILGGRLELDPSLRDAVQPDDAVFIFIRDVKGGKMPLAVLRTAVRELPTDFVFRDEAGTPPGQSLRQHPRLQLLARLSRHGDAMPKSGDYESKIQEVSPGTLKAKLILQHRLP